MKKLFALIGVAFVSITSIYSQCTDLFFSEYIEGGASNKAIEIYNPTSGIIDLSDYELKLYSNGNSTTSATLMLSGSISPGGTYSVANTSSNATLAAAVDLLNNVCNFNGDDAFVLHKISTGTDIDIIGEVGVDPGASWPVGSGSTQNRTLVRMASINQGETNWTVGANEWVVHPQDDFNFIGSHTMTPCVAPSNPEVQFSGTSANIDEDGVSIDINVTITGENSNPTSVDVVLLMTGTASEGTDFTYASTATITFPASSSANQIVTIPIIDNAILDGDLTFELQLQNQTNSATIGTNGNIVVTIVDDEIPVYNIDQVNDLDADGVTINDGLECILHGYVYGVNLRSSGLQFTIHDGTGGIGIINFSSNLGYTVAEGDSIDVTGTIDQYNGYLQLQATEINLHSQGHGLAAPTVVTALDESTESELIQINDVYILDIMDWDGQGAGFNVDVTDGVSTFTLRVDDQVDLFSMMGPDATFDVIGLGGQFDSSSPYDEGYQILPRYNNDIQIKPEIIGGDQMICPGDSIKVDYQNVTYDWFGSNATTQSVLADTAGTYTVDVSYGSVTKTISAMITISSDIPDAGFTVSDISICNNTDVTVTDTSINANAISIDFGDGNSSNSSPAVNQYASDGVYTIAVAATSAFGCVDSATTQITINDCASVIENESFVLNVYPNPTNGLTQISTNIQGVYDLKVVDLTGQVVEKIRTSNQIVDLNLTNRSAGVYFVNITSPKGTNTVKLIVR